MLSVHVDGWMGAEAAVAPRGEWNTWEELVLGSSVLRHGTRDWNVVVSELRARSHRPHCFTPQACRAKYEDLQKRYSAGSKSWFEELRKQHVEELRQELARSEDLIGSLELKIKSLEAERQNSCHDGCNLRKIESPLPAVNSNGGMEFSNKETTKDESSAGSFTKGTHAMVTWSCDHAEKNSDTKSDRLSSSFEQDKELSTEKWMTIRKRRGPRKRKDCANGADKEGSVGESDSIGSSNVASSTNCDHTAKDTYMETHTEIPEKKTGVMEIFESIAQSEPSSVFGHRLDSQRRTRYRKLVMQHVDMGTIRSKITKESTKTAAELFRDLLLLANNALVFYSRHTVEYKSALCLRHLVSQEYKKHCPMGGGSCNEATSSFPFFNPPVKPRTARPRPPPQPRQNKLSDAGRVVSDDSNKNSEGEAVKKEKPCHSDDSVLLCSLLKAKKGVKRRLVKMNDELAETAAVKQTERVGK